MPEAKLSLRGVVKSFGENPVLRGIDLDVAPGEIIHMDENGAVKFPADRLEEVVTLAKELLAEEDDRVGRLLKATGGIEEVRAIMAGHEYVKK